MLTQLNWYGAAYTKRTSAAQIGDVMVSSPKPEVLIHVSNVYGNEANKVIY